MSLILRKSEPASAVAANPWLLARERYLDDLSDEERRLFSEASLENLFYTASAAEKLHNARSKSRALSKRIQPLLDSLEQYGKALDVYSNASPTIMCPLWGSVRVLLHIASEFGKYFDKLQDMFARIGDMLPRFRVYEKLFPDHGQLINALSIAYVDIIIFCIDAKTVFRRGKKQSVASSFKLLWRPFERQFDEVIDRFRIHKENVEKEAGLADMIEAAGARAIEQASRKDKLRRRLLKQLSSVDQDQKQRDFRKHRHANTAVWLTDTTQFKDWLGAKKSTCLWCYGIPGCGKTILTTSVVDYLTTMHTALAFYYCVFSDPNTLTVPAILGCLIKQMLDKIEIPNELAWQIDQHYKCGTRIPATEELTALLLQVMTYFSEVYIVIDGIDECESLERVDILSTIIRLTSHEKQIIKVFVASRYDVDIERSLVGCCCIGVAEECIKGDITSYISDAVNANVRNGKLVVRDSSLVYKIIEVLSQGARGMFLWVSFQLEELCEAVSDHEIRGILQNLPKDLAATYERILGRIRRSKRGSEKMAMARKIFEWISCARRPLSIEELKEAIAFGPTDVVWDVDKIPTENTRLIQACGNLVIIDEHDQTVRLAHYTVLQFLTSAPTDTSTAGFHFDRVQADINAGEICVAYLSFSEFETQLTRSEPNHALRDMQLLESAFLNRKTYLQGFTKTLWDLWNAVRGPMVPSDQLSINFGPIINQVSPAPQVLQEKYQLLNYVIDNWVWHTTGFSEENTKMWYLFCDLALEKQKLFDFRPWNDVVGAKDLPYHPVFLWAVASGHVPLLRLLMKPPRGVNLKGYCDHESKYAQSPLVVATRHDHVEVMELLLAVSDIGVLNSTLLHLAVASGRSKPVKVLLDRGCDADAKDSDGLTGLEVAVQNGHELTVKELLTHGAEIDRRGSDGRTPLHWAARGGHEATVRLLIEKGADVNAKGGAGQTALHWAARAGHEATERLLIEKGADVNAQDGTGQTALHWAAGTGHEAAERLLIEKGADVNAEDGTGQTALHWAARAGHEAAERLLIEKGADVNAKDGAGQTALHWAARAGHEAAERLLIEKGADVNAKDGTGQTALHWAARTGHEATERLLIEKGADVNAKDGWGRTPLHWAAGAGHEAAARLLIEKGADVKAKDKSGETALNQAAELGVVRLLKSI